MTTSSNGFEAYFDADMVLVIAVCVKKERFCLKVTDCDIADGCWVRYVIILWKSHFYHRLCSVSLLLPVTLVAVEAIKLFECGYFLFFRHNLISYTNFGKTVV